MARELDMATVEDHPSLAWSKKIAGLRKEREFSAFVDAMIDALTEGYATKSLETMWYRHAKRLTSENPIGEVEPLLRCLKGWPGLQSENSTRPPAQSFEEPSGNAFAEINQRVTSMTEEELASARSLADKVFQPYEEAFTRYNQVDSPYWYFAPAYEIEDSLQFYFDNNDPARIIAEQFRLLFHHNRSNLFPSPPSTAPTQDTLSQLACPLTNELSALANAMISWAADTFAAANDIRPATCRDLLMSISRYPGLDATALFDRDRTGVLKCAFCFPVDLFDDVVELAVYGETRDGIPDEDDAEILLALPLIDQSGSSDDINYINNLLGLNLCALPAPNIGDIEYLTFSLRYRLNDPDVAGLFLRRSQELVRLSDRDYGGFSPVPPSVVAHLAHASEGVSDLREIGWIAAFSAWVDVEVERGRDEFGIGYFGIYFAICRLNEYGADPFKVGRLVAGRFRAYEAIADIAFERRSDVLGSAFVSFFLFSQTLTFGGSLRTPWVKLAPLVERALQGPGRPVAEKAIRVTAGICRERGNLSEATLLESMIAAPEQHPTSSVIHWLPRSPTPIEAAQRLRTTLGDDLWSRLPKEFQKDLIAAEEAWDRDASEAGIRERDWPGIARRYATGIERELIVQYGPIFASDCFRDFFEAGPKKRPKELTIGFIVRQLGDADTCRFINDKYPEYECQIHKSEGLVAKLQTLNQNHRNNVAHGKPGQSYTVAQFVALRELLYSDGLLMDFARALPRTASSG